MTFSAPILGRAARLAFAGLAAAALILPAGASAARTSLGRTFPVLYVYETGHLLHETADVSLGLYDLDSAAETDMLSLTTPSGYGVAMTHPVGYKLGTAEVGLVGSAGAKPTEYQGALTVMDPATYAANAGAQACAPGTHTAVWNLQALVPTSGKELDIPVAVDRAGKGYRMTMCFGDAHAQGKQLSYVLFTMTGVFRNPVHAGKYLFDASVTPFAADGTASTATSYELRGYENLPELLSATPSYDPATKVLTVQGTLTADGAARDGINVHIWVGQSDDPDTMKEVGVAVTGSNGAYTFSKHLVTQPKFLIGEVHHYQFPTCVGSSPQPGGCASYTIDGRQTYVTQVAAGAPVS